MRSTSARLLVGAVTTVTVVGALNVPAWADSPASAERCAVPLASGQPHPLCQRSSSGGVAKGNFNGDAYGDIAIGVPGQDGGAGVVIVVYGTEEGLNYSARQIIDQSWAGGTQEADDRFGSSLASGNFDGDQWSDLAIGVPGEDLNGLTDAGAVHVLRGTGTGVTTFGARIWSQYDGIGTVEAGDQFGASLVWADFGVSTHGDLAIGVPGEDVGSIVDAGAVHVLYGSGVGISPAGDLLLIQGQAGLAGTAEPNDRFGSVLAAGNLGGDPQAELVIGTPNEAIGPVPRAGFVQILFGGAPGLDPTRQMSLQQGSGWLSDTAEAYDYLGSAFGVGDFDGDGQRDLAVSAPFETIDSATQGLVHVVYGGGAGPNPGRQQTFSLRSLGQPGGSFGYALAGGDFDGDGNFELAVGQPYAEVAGAPYAGRVLVLRGRAATGLDATAVDEWLQYHIWHSGNRYGTNSLLEFPEAGDLVGASLSAWNFGRGSQADLAIGVLGEDADEYLRDVGVMHVVYGSTTGLSRLDSVPRADFAASFGVPVQAGAKFGSALY